MLEPPDILEESIIACLRQAYGLPVSQVDFLPWGADLNTAVYRAVAEDQRTYFVKLRSGSFDEIIVSLPKCLSDQGICQIIAPLPTSSGRLWASLEPYQVILYPFWEGFDGYAVELSQDQWQAFGAALRRIHTATLPAALLDRIPVETFSPAWRDGLRRTIERLEGILPPDDVARRAVAFLKSKHHEILDLVERAESLARMLQARPLESIVCHSDLHAGNLLVTPGGDFYIVDWDNPIRAPKERDLMFIGGAQGFHGRTPQEEETIFYQGYGQVALDRQALAYYRTERIVQDIAIYAEQLLLSGAGGEDRQQSLCYLMSNFLPGNTIEAAYRP